MKVKKNCHVRINFKMSLANGDLVDASEEGEPLEFICGRGQVVTGLERELIGMQPGQQKRFVVAAADAYGAHDPTLVNEIPRAGFPIDRKLEKGQCFSYRSKKGAELRYRVVDVKRETIVADFNHPLAGKPLHCEVEILDVREDSGDALYDR
ncbi:MAG: FKBP-type peptidyl-prolyl cis-trans isomerase [Myxococcota bacterium]